VRVPALVMHGSEDQIVPVGAGAYTARHLSSARFVELPGVGHVALSAGGTQTRAEIERFLTDVWQAGGWEDAEPDRMLATVLFTDIVESTAKAIELGDRRWRDLLERHHRLVRRELLRYRGREINTAGDGFLAAFDGPARAIRCACAIVEGVRDLGLSVRAGLHTGECEVTDGNLAGIAVHTGARVAALAGADEVLVSTTVSHRFAADFGEAGRGGGEHGATGPRPTSAPGWSTSTCTKPRSPPISETARIRHADRARAAANRRHCPPPHETPLPQRQRSAATEHRLLGNPVRARTPMIEIGSAGES
jgi:class 3 adenylate cyclase